MATAMALQSARTMRLQSCLGRKPTAFKPAKCPRARHHYRLVQSHAAASKAEATVAKPAEDVFEDEDEPEQLPSSEQVQGLLKVLVQETEIAEMHLQLGSFEMKVRRNTSQSPAAYAASAAAPAAAAAPAPVIAAPPAPVELSMEETMDESLVSVEAAKVGIFRRGRYAGGKKVGKAPCVNEKEQVKKGATIGYIEQLGTYFEVKAPQAGEVVRIFVEDGGPVEYKQVICEMAPFFGGHIIGDKKYA